MITVKIADSAGAFAEDKDVAASIRDTVLRTALASNQTVRLDFKGVEGATQSFVHAMVSDLIRTQGAAVLRKIEFKSCNATIRSVIEIVADYSQLEEPVVQTEKATRGKTAPTSTSRRQRPVAKPRPSRKSPRARSGR